LKSFFKTDQPISGVSYFLWGVGLFLLKFPLDYIIASRLFGKKWDLFVYFSYVRNPLFNQNQSDPIFWMTMLAIALPFVALGLIFTFRRINTLKIHPFWVLMFFLPFLNVAFFLILTFWPNPPTDNQLAKLHNLTISEFTSQKKLLWILIGIGFGILVGGAFMFLSHKITMRYGTMPFVGIPFFIGFFTVVFINYRSRLTIREAIGYSILAISLGLLFVTVTYIEGILCVLMAAPIVLALSALGGVFAYSICQFNQINKNSAFKSIFLLPLFLLFDSGLISQNLDNLDKTVSIIKIQAHPTIVWQNVVEFRPIEDKWDGLFSNHLPKLDHAVIDSPGVGGLRKCVFDQGIFYEPITVWEKPRNLTFGVDRQIEKYSQYLETTQGQFLIEPQPDGSSKLIGTTWYKIKLHPKTYWKMWANYIMHKIHMRALSHIKQLSEQSEPS